MTVAADLGRTRTTSHPRHALPTLERSLTRINELLVRRANSAIWWAALGQALDELTGALALHRAATAGRDGLHGQILEQQPRLAFDLRRLERDHAELAEDVAELQDVVAASSSRPGGLPVVLAATTEVIARIRGHQRRLGTVMHEAYQRDLGNSG